MHAEKDLKRKRDLLTRYHQHAQAEWASDRDYSKMKRTRRTIQVGVIYTRISLHWEYEAYGVNEDGAKIRICFPKSYFEFNRRSSCEQIMWEIKRLSFTRIENVLVFNNPNPEPSDCSEMLCICPHQIIYDKKLPEALQTPEYKQAQKERAKKDRQCERMMMNVANDIDDNDDEDEEEEEGGSGAEKVRAVCTHYIVKIDPTKHKDFPSAWPDRNKAAHRPDKFHGFIMLHSHFNGGTFFLQRPPLHATLRRPRFFVLKPVMPEIDPHLPLEGYSSRFGLVSGKTKLSVHMEYIEVPLFVQCYRRDALDERNWPKHPIHVYEKQSIIAGSKRPCDDDGDEDADEDSVAAHAQKRQRAQELE